MPDIYGFDHLGGCHRCIEENCGWPGHGVSVSERDRKRHHAQHERLRKQQSKRAQEQALAKGRRLLAAQRRENERAYRKEEEG